ncbi:RNA polymerase recycling motor HelD [Paenibacillus naphthalenovorans]|uniref:Helicase n=1 Tax=Paenibacillus naphthalenovorans TaxID=162209 RepID=A0A0U2UNC3_9BACL|nr:RNA polymerase recycling motor HelD [Paenibacillus naphthalenovorans]ALS24556.1 helicase [Paenibacillus naphthalenovorans]SDJ11356.1 DNA helicase-2 / ATP-dependent DNA helicase PcrA [Paenibacillus naphthalenovorans]
MTQDAAWWEEQHRLKLVLNEVRKLIERSEELSEQRKSTVTEARKDFWDDITVNLANPDDIMETYTSITQQSMMLAGQERSLQHAENTRYRLLRMYNSPYFGRIDFTEKGSSGTEKIYIGIASVLDEQTQTYWVYDWRAPVSSLFYDYSPGPANYETPMGTISGTLDLKRQFMIRGGEIKAMFNTGITIGDEVLQHILGQRTDDHMKSIVATIQKEQNQIIRDDRHRVLIVQGAAGSGKTSVALQRVAYLLYKHRQTLNSDNMVLFSPNALFNSYISSVLPELGEANMQQTTYQDYLQLRLGSQFQVEDAYEQMEAMLHTYGDPGDEIRRSSIRFKSSKAFVDIIEKYARGLESQGMRFNDLVFRGRVLIGKQQMANYFYSLDGSIKLSIKIHLVKEWLLKELKRLAKEERMKPWVKEEIELLDKEVYQQAYNALRKQKGDRETAFDDAKQEALLLSKYVVHEKFKPLREKIKQLRFISAAALYRQLISDVSRFALTAGDKELELPPEWEEIGRLTLEQMDRGRLTYEDATPFLYLTGLIEGFPSYNTVRHVIIDEAQDYSPFQLVFLNRLFPWAKMTLLGDFNQAISAHHTAEADHGMAGYEVIYDLYGPEQVEFIRLVRSYRSTKEIAEFTKAILPFGEPVEPFSRSGEPPKLIAVSDHAMLTDVLLGEVKRLQTSGIGTIAIICKTARETRDAYDKLSSQLPQLQWITKETRLFHAGVVLIPVYLAKGLEFDAVLIYNASAEHYYREVERKLLYTACTRAMHKLTIFHTGQPSPFLSHHHEKSKRTL